MRVSQIGWQLSLLAEMIDHAHILIAQHASGIANYISGLIQSVASTAVSSAMLSSSVPSSGPSPVMAADQGSLISRLAGPDTLIIVCMVFGLVAMGAVTKVFVARKETRSAARLARSRALGMRELLRTMRMAETIAGIGIWQYDPSTGVQQWSDGLKKLFGVDTEEEFVDGDAETLLFANNIDLIGKTSKRKNETEPYAMQFDIFGYNDSTKTITVHACNLRDGEGNVQRVVAVVRDETEQVMRERALKSSREQAVNQAREAQIQADTDSLTGLANRRRVMRELDKLVITARVTQMPLVLVMFDIDRFKKVNDTHGHPAGDEVLKRVSEIAQEQTRELDILGRVGGEEFVWVIPGGSDGMARIMSERLRQAVASGSAIGGVPAVTISVGYTTLHDGDSALSLFARADNALYDAKHSGRNRVRMAA